MPGEQDRRYLFVAFDGATRWVFLHAYAQQSDSSSTDCLIKVKNACPVKIVDQIHTLARPNSRSLHNNLKIYHSNVANTQDLAAEKAGFIP